jgi:acetyltransferase-like isoleucine patch superfamily enzyme
MTVKGNEIVIAKSAKVDPSAEIVASTIIIGENAIIGKGFIAKVAGRLEIGTASVVKGTRILCRNATIGTNNYIDGVLIEGSPNSRSQNVRIGNENLILQNTRINCNEDVSIGNDVGIGQYVDIWTHGSFMDVLAGYPYSSGPVTIGNHVWITAHSTIMPGVTVGDHVIIGNNTIANKSVPGGCFFAGMPGKVVKENIYPLKFTQEQQEKLLDVIICEYLETCKHKGFTPEINRNKMDIHYKSPDGAKAIFQTKDRSVQGDTDKYTEDFRDYLRFRCVKFFTDVPFKSILPLDYQNIENME